MDHDAPAREHVTGIMKSLGYTVSTIDPDPVEKRADLRASIAGESCLIEIKSKELSPFYVELLREAQREGIAERTRIVRSDNTLSRIVQDAEEQLTSTPASDASLRLVWFVCLHPDATYVRDCLRATLYGVVSVATLPPMRRADLETPTKIDVSKLMRDCFYYRYGDFYRRRQIDAAVVTGTPCEPQLYANNFSPNIARLRLSALYSVLASRRAVEDPELLEQQERALIIREGIDRKTPGTQWPYLKKLYGLNTQEATDIMWDGVAIAPRPGGKDPAGASS